MPLGDERSSVVPEPGIEMRICFVQNNWSLYKRLGFKFNIGIGVQIFWDDRISAIVEDEKVNCGCENLKEYKKT